MNDILKINVYYELLTMLDDQFLMDEQITPITQKKTKSFKRFYLESLLNESPLRYKGDWRNIPLEDWTYNQTEANSFREGLKGKLIDYFQYLGNVRIYQVPNIENDSTEFALIPETMQTILGYVKIVFINNYATTNGIWNHQINGKGLVYNFFINWLIPHYELLISDKTTTPLGEAFWKKIIEYGLKHNKECGIFTEAETNLQQPEQFQKLDKIEDFEKAWTENGFAKRIYIQS